MNLFPETMWTKLLEPIRQRGPTAQLALEELCERYRKPLVAVAGLILGGRADPEDVVQGFLLHLLQRDDLANVDRAKGRFRAFLKVSLRHYIIDWERRNHRIDLVPIDVVDEALLAEDDQITLVFEREFALSILAHANARVRAWYEKKGKLAFYEAFSGMMPGADPEFSHAEVAASLGISLNQARVEFHRFRERLESAVRQEVALTVTEPKDVEEELLEWKRAVCRCGT